MIRNFLAAVGCLTVAVALILAGWFYRAEITEWGRGLLGDEVVATEPSPELAERAEEKLAGLLAGEADDEVRLSETELQSYVRYRLASRFPEGVTEPSLDLRDSVVHLSAALDLVRLGETSQAAANLRRFMGDSARVNTELHPRVQARGLGGLRILSLQAGLVPVPPMFIPQILAQAGFETEEGRTVVFPIPVEVREIWIEDEEIVLRQEREER